MNIDAIEKIAQDSINPYSIGGSAIGALLGHIMTKPDDDDEEQSTWDKVKHWLGVLGGGAAGYYLGDGISSAGGGSDGGSPNKLTNYGANAARGASYLGHAAAGVSGAHGLAEISKPFWKRIGSTYKTNYRSGGKKLGLAALAELLALGMGYGADKLNEAAKNK